MCRRTFSAGVSIHAPHTGRDNTTQEAAEEAEVSIHAPHTGRDSHFYRTTPSFRRFNPRAPHGARPFAIAAAHPPMLFQSTRPTRGATVCHRSRASADAVSIHAPHTGRDQIGSLTRALHLFQSTRPTRGATAQMWTYKQLSGVSIHAPHTGRDSTACRS